MHFSKSSLVKMLGIAVMAASFGCASEPVKKASISESADPTAEIQQLERDLNTAAAQQVNVMAPQNFAAAVNSLKEARTRRSDNQPNADVLEKVAESRAHLDVAQKKSAISQAALGPVLEARAAAVATGAPNYFTNEFRSADEDLLDVTRAIEEGDTKAGEKERQKLTAEYMTLEMKGIQQASLGKTLEIFEQAKQEGAAEWAPKTYARVEKEIAGVQQIIKQDPKARERIDEAAATALKDTEFLLRVTRQSKLVKTRNPEDTVLSMEQQREEVAALGSEASSKDEELTEQQKQLDRLESKEQVNERFKRVRALFKKNEADVFRTDGLITIRLKGLKFETGKETIPPEHFALLKKVEDALKQFPEKSVTIEGHTDSVGSIQANQRVSEKRAEAVKEFLVAAEAVPDENVSVEGKGFSEPIANNKTKEGRAQNRRVDIVIETVRG